MSTEIGWGNVPEGWWLVKGYPEYMINAALDVRLVESGHKMLDYKDKEKKGAQARYVRLASGTEVHTCYIWELGKESIPPF